MRAQEVLYKYVQAASDAEAESIERGLNDLIAKRKSGGFGAGDAEREQQLLARYRSLIEHSAELKRLALGSAAQTRSAPVQDAHSSSSHTEPAVAIDHQAHVDSSPDVRSAEGKPFTTLGREPARSILSKEEELDSLINRVQTLESSIAVIIDATPMNDVLVRRIYSELRKAEARVITDLFQERPFKANGFFAQLVNGDTTVLRRSSAMRQVGHLAVGELRWGCDKTGFGPADADLITCTSRLDVKVFNREGAIVKSQFVTARGPGFSDEDALRITAERLATITAESVLAEIK